MLLIKKGFDGAPGPQGAAGNKGHQGNTLVSNNRYV